MVPTAGDDGVLPVPDVADMAEQLSWLEQEDHNWPNLKADGVLGKMVDLVKVQPGYEPVAQALLGDVVVVDNLERAQKMWAENGHRKTMVTLDGEVLDPVGLLTGGTSSSVSSGLLSQKREIKELTEQVRRLEAKLLVSEEQFRSLKQAVEKLSNQLQSMSDENHQGDLAIVNLERDLTRLQEEAKRELEAAQGHEQAAAALKERLGLMSSEQDETEAKLKELSDAHQKAQSEIDAQQAHLAALRGEERAIAEALTQTKVEVAANREKRDSSQRNLARLLQRIKDVTERLEKLGGTIEKNQEELAKLKENIEVQQKEGESFTEQLEAQKSAVEEARQALEAETIQLKEEDGQIRSRRKASDERKEQLTEAQMKVREHQIAQENLKAQIDERYRLNLSKLVTDFHLVQRQSEEHVAKTEKLRKQLSNIGAINLTAIEECQEVRQRYDFLSDQKKDLEEAIASLRTAIRKINKTSKERYIEAFRLVNEKFQQVFPKLFNGGRCALVLTDENNPLESGVEILAQPPGKKLQSVSLLSGGEKALTAVALIFGIFLIKPTPFCLLDEVDAPLDEANVGRYNEMLREMSAISQFILITHNKRTMELPDRLYGVTMENPGVSKIVPVDVTSPEDQQLKVVS